MKIIIIFPIISFLMDGLLVYLNITYQKKGSLRNQIFDEEQYSIFLEYSKEKQINKIISLFFELVFIVSILLFLFKSINSISVSIFTVEILQQLFTIFVLYTMYQLIKSVCDMYDAFTTETKYGFNKSSISSFLKDQCIDYLVTLIILLIGMYLMIVLYNEFQEYFLLSGFLLVIALQILYHGLFSTVFIPLLFKYEKLDNNELKTKIKDLAKLEGFKLEDIFVVKASEKTSKLNAMFSGFGKSKKVLLFDTLLETFTHNQIISIIAHEIGHYKNHDMLRDLIIAICRSILLFSVFYFILMNNIAPNLLLSLISFIGIYPLVDKILKIISNTVSRYEEKQADIYVKKLGYGDDLIDSLTIAVKNNMSNLHPHPMFTFFKVDHPPYLSRVNYLKKPN